jgi:hypothetical protein
MVTTGTLKLGLNKEEARVFIDELCDAKGISDEDRRKLHETNESRRD